MEDSYLDKHILLVSADWFQPFFTIFWPSIAEDRVVSVKKAARASVKDMMSTFSIYWNIPFSQERLDKTKDTYSKQLGSIGLNDSEIADLIRRSNKNDLKDEVIGNSAWLLWTLTEHLVNFLNAGPLANLDEHEKSILQQAYRDINEKHFAGNLEKAFKNSDSTWDVYLKSLTPDLPSFLYDYAEIHVAGFEKFRVFWMAVRKILDVDVRMSLIQWYLDEIEEIADPDFNLIIPKWLE